MSDFTSWMPADPTNVMHWFSLNIGIEGERGSEVFQLPIATRRAIDARRDKSKPYRGLLLDPFVPSAVDALLREFVSGVTGDSWDEIVTKLRRKSSLYEYE